MPTVNLCSVFLQVGPWLFAGMGFLAGYLLQRMTPRQSETAVDQLTARLEDELPQTQCGQCGYVGCKPYAAAMATGQATTLLCVPGGKETVKRLQQILGVEKTVENLEEIPQAKRSSPKTRAVASIYEPACVGCSHCIKVCPVDAIVGTRRLVHTVVQEFCTGCERCLSVCPTRCIILKQIPTTTVTLTLLSDQPIESAK